MGIDIKSLQNLTAHYIARSLSLRAPSPYARDYKLAQNRAISQNIFNKALQLANDVTLARGAISKISAFRNNELKDDGAGDLANSLRKLIGTSSKALTGSSKTISSFLSGRGGFFDSER